MDKRFPSFAIVKAFAVLHPATWKHSSVLDSASKGMLSVLIDAFSVGSQAIFHLPDRGTAARREKVKKYIMEAECMVVALNRMPPNATLLSAWSELRKVNGAASNFPNFLKLAYVMFTIPVQSAAVERGFSWHNNLKTKLRNALHVMTVDSVLRIQDQVSAIGIFTLDLKRAVEVYKHKPPRQEIRPLLIRQLFKAAGLHDEGGALPDVLYDGVDLEITDAFQAAGVDEECDDDECVVEDAGLDTLFGEVGHCEEGMDAAFGNHMPLQQEEVILDDVFSSLL